MSDAMRFPFGKLIGLICLLLAGAPAHAALHANTPDWQPVDAANPNFTLDRANIGQSLFPVSDPYGNQMVHSWQLVRYMKVSVKITPGPDGAAAGTEDWAFDCAGKYAVLATVNLGPDGKSIFHTAIDYHNGAKGLPGEHLGTGMWGPEHFMMPVSADPRAVQVDAIACAPQRTSLAPVPVQDMNERHWTRGRKEAGAGGWNDEHIVLGSLGNDDVTMVMNLFARPRSPRGPFDLEGAKEGVEVGLSVTFSRKLDFFPTGRYPWGLRVFCKVALTGNGLDTGWGFDPERTLPGRATLLARTPGAAQKLMTAVFAGNYDLSVTCDDYPQSVIFHIANAMPERMQLDFMDNLRLLGGLTPRRETEGL